MTAQELFERTQGTPEINVNRFWSISSVRQCCIDNVLYTEGDNEEYDKMLVFVSCSEPTYENIYIVARDIERHSSYQTITNIMFLLEREAVHTTFEIDGEDDI